MIRHLIPRIEYGRWTGDGLTYHASEAKGPRRRDEIAGGIACIQWLGLTIEIGIGRVR